MSLEETLSVMAEGIADCKIDDNDPVSRFVSLEHEKRDLEERLEEIKQEMNRLQETILERWSDVGQKAAKIRGYTVYVASDFWCTKRPGVDTEEVCRRLEAVGLGNLVSPSYSAQSLKAWVRERLAEVPEGSDPSQFVPDEIAEVLQWGENIRLRMRKG